MLPGASPAPDSRIFGPLSYYKADYAKEEIFRDIDSVLIVKGISGESNL